MNRTARFSLFVAVAVFAAAKVAAQETPSAGPDLQPNAGGEETTVKRLVDGIMQPHLAEGQHRERRGQQWRRSPDLGAIVALSLHGHRYFFPYGKATDAGAPFRPDTLVEIGSCTKTFTTTLFALAINGNPNRARRSRPEIHAERLHAPGATVDTAGAGRLHFGIAGRSDQPSARARTEEHRALHGERLSHLGFELRTEDPIACAL